MPWSLIRPICQYCTELALIHQSRLQRRAGLKQRGRGKKFDKGATPGYLKPMKSIQYPSTRWVSRRWVNVSLLITLFFLSLHFHVAVTAPQLAKECSCIHGSRTEAGLATPPAGGVPVVAYQLIESCCETEFVFHAVSTKASRAPPSLVSL